MYEASSFIVVWILTPLARRVISRIRRLNRCTEGSGSVLVHRLAHLIHASFRPHLAAVALASSLGLHLHQVGRRTFTSKLLSMPSTRRSRWRGRRFRVLDASRIADSRDRELEK